MPKTADKTSSSGALKCETWVRRGPSGKELFVLRVRAPKLGGGCVDQFFPRGVCRDYRAVETDLLDAGIASLPDRMTPSQLLETSVPRGYLVLRPGWHDGTFVGVDQTVKGQEKGKGSMLYRHQPSGQPTYLGPTAGKLKAWKQRVAEPAKASTTMMYAIMCALAAPLARHAGLAEGAVFCIVGPSSTGKTTIALVAASVAGDPSKVLDFNLTSTGAEELAAAHSDHLLILDDTERSIGDVAKLVDEVTHVVTGGQSRKRTSLWNTALLPTDWFTFGLMTSPASIASISGKTRSVGKQVRLIELPVPSGAQGVFDQLGKGQTSGALAETVSLATHQQHGTLFEKWSEALPHLRNRVAAGVRDLVKTYEVDQGVTLSGAERRLLTKLFLPVWAGKKAVQGKLLPWTVEDATDAGMAVIGRAFAAFRKAPGDPRSAWLWLAAEIEEGGRVFDIRGGKRLPRPLQIGPSQDTDIGVIDDADGVLKIGLTLGVIQRLQQAGVTELEKHLGPVTQSRLKAKTGKDYRPRLRYMPLKAFKTIIEAGAGRQVRPPKFSDPNS